MDRKARIREYKETARPMGIYRVRNTANGKWLIGSSVNLPAILNRQRFQLELGSHPNRALQADWKEFGPEAFVFEVLDTLEPSDTLDYNTTEDLQTLTEMWIDKLCQSDGPGYNRQPMPGH
jgi:hypothetical protein